jgi:hypothetical protein
MTIGELMGALRDAIAELRDQQSAVDAVIDNLKAAQVARKSVGLCGKKVPGDMLKEVAAHPGKPNWPCGVIDNQQLPISGRIRGFAATANDDIQGVIDTYAAMWSAIEERIQDTLAALREVADLGGEPDTRLGDHFASQAAPGH